MTSDERIDKLAETVQNLERVMRQGFQVLTELHGDTQREMASAQADTQKAFQKLANSMSALADHVADHDSRLDKLDGGQQ